MTRKINAIGRAGLNQPGFPPALAHGQWCRGWHRVAWRLFGAEGAPVWVALHGGPGSGCSPSLLAPFDLSRCRVLLIDQRGCGASRPRGGRAQTGLAHLVADLEGLRRQLGLAQWSVLGGSWGATLALAYARAHAHRLQALVLRGAFFWQRQTLRGVYRPALGLALQGLLSPPGAVSVRQGWPQVLQGLARVFHFGKGDVTHRQALMAWQWLERRAVLAGWQRAHRAGHPGQPPAAPSGPPPAGLVALRRAQRRQLGALRQPAPLDTVLAWRARLHWATLGLHRRPPAPWAQQAVRALAQQQVPVDWVHGRWDRVCPPQAAWAVHRRFPEGLSRWHAVEAGHLAVEPALLQRLRTVVATVRSGR